MPYPWCQPVWERLQTARAGGRLPHGVLLAGPRGSGKGELAQMLARVLLCGAADAAGTACGSCRGCELMTAGTHPDFFRLAPKEQSKVIKIDQVRELIAFLTLTTQFLGQRVAIIEPADAMNRHAANSLLKTLEEPPRNTALILITHAPDSLPVTVRSRCQRFTLHGMHESKREWLATRLRPGADPDIALALAAGGPLLALDLDRDGLLKERATLLGELTALRAGRLDPVLAAARWMKIGAPEMVRLLRSLLCDMVRVRLAGGGAPIGNDDLRGGFQHVTKGLDLSQLFSACDTLTGHRRLLEGGANVREQDLLEEFALMWVE
ncbi:MAG: DNA polymerase III subunit delta' [Chromatiales bacterium]